MASWSPRVLDASAHLVVSETRVTRLGRSSFSRSEMRVLRPVANHLHARCSGSGRGQRAERGIWPWQRLRQRSVVQTASFGERATLLLRPRSGGDKAPTQAARPVKSRPELEYRTCGIASGPAIGLRSVVQRIRFGPDAGAASGGGSTAVSAKRRPSISTRGVFCALAVLGAALVLPASAGAAPTCPDVEVSVHHDTSLPFDQNPCTGGTGTVTLAPATTPAARNPVLARRRADLYAERGLRRHGQLRLHRGPMGRGRPSPRPSRST